MLRAIDAETVITVEQIVIFAYSIYVSYIVKQEIRFLSEIMGCV